MVDLTSFAYRWCVRCERKTSVRETLRSEPKHLERGKCIMKKTERSRSWGVEGRLYQHHGVWREDCKKVTVFSI